MRRLLERAALQIPAIDRLYRHRDELLAECARQAAQAEALTAERNDALAERAALLQRIEALSTDLGRATAEIAALSQRQDELEAQLGRVGAEVQTRGAERDRLMSELDGARARAKELAEQCERQAAERARERETLTGEIGRLASLAVHSELLPDGPPVTPAEAIGAASASATAAAVASGPLVSIVCVCRNAEQFITRALTSMQAQTYANTELLVQDGGSTDRTVEIARTVERAKVVSEHDAAALDGMLRAARRAKGEIIAVCWADDELLPHAAGWAAAMFERHAADVIYGDQLFVFENGAEWIAQGVPWDRAKFLRQEFFPPFSSSFFRRSALVALAEQLTVFDHDEFEFWLWLDRLGALRYVPGLVSKFHVHDRSRWTKAGYCETMVRGRRRAIERFAAMAGSDQNETARAELGVELWAALHEISCARSIEDSLKHLERVQDRFDGDPRFLMTLARLLNESKIDGLRHAERILRVGQKLGFDFGVLAQRRPD